MGSSIGRAIDDEREQQWKEDVEHLDKLAKKVADDIRNTRPSSSEFDDVIWLFKNKAKILRNRKLIDLIG